jgi:hypothetical protein
MTTPKASGRECITHHRACDCREAELAAVTAENERLREALNAIREWADVNLDDGCSCGSGYGDRHLADPSCEWHNLDTADLYAILAPGGGEKGAAE